jgi:ABC-2 type transport system ATP-binding protein
MANNKGGVNGAPSDQTASVDGFSIALEVIDLGYSYGSKAALSQLSLQVDVGEIFALLGPNGSGKTTLFRLISTLARVQQGDIQVFGCSVKSDLNGVRSNIGIVFQSPSLDRKLTVLENIRCQAALYGLSGSKREHRIDEVLEQLGITDRRNEIVEKLSGGLKRRVEIAKGILHRPKLMLLDEPSTGLDPASRLDLWHALESLRADHSVTVVLTTHLLEEADKSDRIAILHQGRTVAVGQPMALRREIGNQVLSIQTTAMNEVTEWLSSQSIPVRQYEHQLRVSGAQTIALIAPLAAEFGDRIQSLTVGQPSLEDVFIARTGHKYW